MEGSFYAVSIAVPKSRIYETVKVGGDTGYISSVNSFRPNMSISFDPWP